MSFNEFIATYNIRVYRCEANDQLEHCSSEEISALLPKCKSLTLYECYNGMYVTLDGVEFLLSDQIANSLKVLKHVHDFFAEYLQTMVDLESFSFPGWSYNELGYKRLQVAPPNLQHFYFTTTQSINAEFVQNATSLQYEVLVADEHHFMPKNLRSITTVNLCLYELDMFKEFLIRLRSLPHFEALIVEDAIGDGEDVYEEDFLIALINEYLPRYFRHGTGG